MGRYVVNQYRYNEMTTFDCKNGTVTFEGLSDGMPISFHNTKEEAFSEMFDKAFNSFCTLCGNDYSCYSGRYKMEINYDEGYCDIFEEIGNGYHLIQKWTCSRLDD